MKFWKTNEIFDRGENGENKKTNSIIEVLNIRTAVRKNFVFWNLWKRLKKAKLNVGTDLCVDCRAADFFSNETVFFIVNQSLRVLLTVSKIARCFWKTGITMSIIIKQKNDYIEKHTVKTDREKKNRIFKKNRHANDRINWSQHNQHIINISPMSGVS